MVIDVNGISMHWEEFGEGEPLLWLHGGMGCGADWRYVFKELPAGCRLIAPDLRGHGASTNSGAFTFRQCALDVRALLDHLKVPRVKAIGLSGGGIVLLHMANRATGDPSCIESMVVVSAPPYFPPEARAIMRQYSEATVGAAEMERMRARHTRGAAQVQELIDMARGFADSYDDVNFTPPQLSTITADTLIVFGDRDPLYPVSIAMELHRAIPRSFLWVVPNGPHGPIFGDLTPQFVTTATAFLRGAWR
jgi:pimeloyl-ACP methyl ester carboxylesterase